MTAQSASRQPLTPPWACYQVVPLETACRLKVFQVSLPQPKNWMRQTKNGVRSLFGKGGTSGSGRNQLCRSELGQGKRKKVKAKDKSTCCVMMVGSWWCLSPEDYLVLPWDLVLDRSHSLPSQLWPSQPPLSGPGGPQPAFRRGGNWESHASRLPVGIPWLSALEASSSTFQGPGASPSSRTVSPGKGQKEAWVWRRVTRVHISQQS